MRVTIRQLAQHCNVSKATIDRVINNKPGVKPQTRERVEGAIAEMGYAPHFLAQSLAKGTTRSIGIVLLNLHNPFFAQLADAMVAAASARGYYPYLMLSQKDLQQEEACVRELAARQVDGLILFSTNKQPDFVQYLHRCGLPIVTPMTPLDGLPNIGIDDFAAMRDATIHVRGRGYCHLVLVSPPLAYENTNTHATRRRYEGFLAALEGSSTRHTVITDYNYLRALEDIVPGADAQTAILCSSDIYALEIVDAFRRRGLCAPRDYGVMGFDNIQTLRYVSPRIATVGVPIADVGNRAVETLVDAIEGRPARDVTLPYEIVPGETLL